MYALWRLRNEKTELFLSGKENNAFRKSGGEAVALGAESAVYVPACALGVLRSGYMDDGRLVSLCDTEYAG